VTLKKEWVDFVHRLAFEKPRYYSGPQKILQGQTWKVKRDDFFDDSLSLQSFGYSDNGNKMSALKRNYFNKEKVRAARKLVKQKWEQRTYGSAGFPLTHQVKHNQDFCMQACTVTHFPSGGLEVCIFYRVTEPIKKFGADLIFLRDIVLPRFDRVKSIEHVTFMFSNISWHPMFICTFLAHHDNPISFMKKVKFDDPKWHEGICKWAIKYLFEAETDWVQNFSIAKQNALAMERLMNKKTKRKLRRYFEEFRK
jgi:hypothetical protein